MTNTDRMSGGIELHSTYNRLNPEIKELLAGSSPDKKEFAHTLNRVLINWCRVGGTLEEFYTEFEKHALYFSYHPELGRYENVIRKAFNSAAEFVDRGADPVAVQERVIQLRERVAAWDLDGVRKYRKPRDTWLSMLDVLIEDYQFDWNRGYRALAIEAGVTPPTARRHVLAGVEIDLIRDQSPGLTQGQIERGTPKPSSKLVFNLDWMQGELLALPDKGESKVNNVTTHSMGILQMYCNKTDFVSDTAWKHMLGTNRRSTFEALGTEPLKVPVIAKVAHLSVNTVRDHLDYLESTGLVTKTKATKGRGYEYSVNQDADTQSIEEEALYWRDQAEQKHDQERLDFNAYSAQWLGWYENCNRPLVPTTGDKPYRLNQEGLSYARGKHKAWEHQQIPEQYREYTDDGVPHRGLWVLSEGEVVEVEDTKTPPPLHGDWFDLLDADKPIDHGIDPFAAPAEEHRAEDGGIDPFAPAVQVLEPVSSLPDHGDEPPF